MAEDNDPAKSAYDPYKLLHIKHDGSFGTKEMHKAFRRLDIKYHPDNVSANVPRAKAIKRYENLIMAYETLTQKPLFDTYVKYGHPKGLKTINAAALGIPTWILDDDFRPILITWCFVMVIAALLGMRVWMYKDSTKNQSGIEFDSKLNMREFLMAILEDNAKGERTVGLSDVDIIELYE